MHLWEMQLGRQTKRELVTRELPRVEGRVPSLGATGRRCPRTGEMFKEFDKDGDGNVTVGEVLQGVFTKISDLFTKETKEEYKKRIFQRAASALRHSQEFRAWSTWVDSMRQRAENLRVIRKCVISFMNAKQRACFECWQDEAMARNEAKLRAQKALARFKHSNESRAINHWVFIHREDKAARQRLKSLMSRVSPEGQAKLKVLDILRAMHAKAQLFRNAAMALLNSQLFRAYNAWHELAEDNKRTAEKVRRVLVRLDPVWMLSAC